MTGRLDRSGANFPAPGYGPRLRTGLVDRDRIASYCGASGFPLSATGHIGPRLRKWPSPTQTGSCLFAEPLGAMVAEMRPFTAFVVIGLVVLIVVAFAVKLATTGLAP